LANLDVLKMYMDHDRAPRRIMASPWLNVEVVAAATASVMASEEEDTEVEIRKRPNKAMAHPPHTEDLMLSPAKADSKGVITTLVWVRKEARAAGLKSRPALIRP